MGWHFYTWAGDIYDPEGTQRYVLIFIKIYMDDNGTSPQFFFVPGLLDISWGASPSKLSLFLYTVMMIPLKEGLILHILWFNDKSHFKPPNPRRPVFAGYNFPKAMRESRIKKENLSLPLECKLLPPPPPKDNALIILKRFSHDISSRLEKSMWWFKKRSNRFSREKASQEIPFQLENTCNMMLQGIVKWLFARNNFPTLSLCLGRPF